MMSIKGPVAIRLVLISVVMSLTLFATQNDQSAVPVFVKAAGTGAGFTDPSHDRQDSTKDLVKKLKDAKVVRLVESEKEALVVLEVLGRVTDREVMILGAQNKSTVAVRLTAGDYSTEFSGTSGPTGMLKGYAAAAGKVAKQVEEWVKANREKLLAIQK